MSDTPISPGAGSVTLAGVAGAMALLMAPLVGSVSFGGTTPALAGSMATLTGSASFAGVAPQLTSGTATVITPTVGAVTLAGVASTVAKPTVTAMVPTVGATTLAGVASTLAQAVGVVTSPDGGLSVWTGIANGQLGTGVNFRANKGSFQVSGTFGSGGSIKLQGSNDLVNWADLSPTALTSAGFFAALGANEKPRAIRPSCTAGDTTTALNVTGWFS